MDWILLLALATFGLIAAYLVWNRVSAGRQTHGTPTSGLGGPNDPLAATTEGMRHPDEMRAALDAASADGPPVQAQDR